MTMHADVAIVGAGVVGLSIAYELSTKTDLSVAIFDKSGPGSGTSTSTSDSSSSPLDLISERSCSPLPEFSLATGISRYQR